MTKQPFLTDFPLVVFATTKRRVQAAIPRTSSIINRRSLSGYAVLFEDAIPGEFLASIDPTERQRSFGHIPVFWACLAQILEANASCQEGVGLIQSWCRVSKLPVPSSDTSSYCKARCRRRLSFLQQIHRRIIAHLSGRIGSRDQWNGFILKAMDGNAVRIQIWTALIAMLLLKLLQFRSRIDWALSNLVAQLRWNLFTYKDLWKWIDDPFQQPPNPPPGTTYQPELDGIAPAAFC